MPPFECEGWLFRVTISVAIRDCQGLRRVLIKGPYEGADGIKQCLVDFYMSGSIQHKGLGCFEISEFTKTSDIAFTTIRGFGLVLCVGLRGRVSGEILLDGSWVRMDKACATLSIACGNYDILFMGSAGVSQQQNESSYSPDWVVCSIRIPMKPSRFLQGCEA